VLFREEALKPYAVSHRLRIRRSRSSPRTEFRRTADPYGLSWFFHYPTKTRLRSPRCAHLRAPTSNTFRAYPAKPNTELVLAAARRVAALAPAAGRTPPRPTGSSAPPRRRPFSDRSSADILSEEISEPRDSGSLGLTREQIQAEVSAQRADSDRLADERTGSCSDPRFPTRCAVRAERARTQRVRRGLRSWAATGRCGPGRTPPSGPASHGSAGPRRAPSAALCHGPALLLSLPERPSGLCLFVTGNRMTSFT